MDITREERGERRETRKSRKEQEMEKRGVKLTRKQQLAQELTGMMSYCASQAEFERMLQGKGFEFYVHGKNFGVRPIIEEGATKKPKSHRFSTLGIHAEYEAFLDRTESLVEDERAEGEKEKADDVEYTLHSEPEGSEQDGPDSDKDPYVKYDSDADPNQKPASQQHHEAEQERDEPERQPARVKEDDMGDPIPPGKDRQEMIDKGHVTPDPETDAMSQQEWDDQDKFSTKVQQSWRRTMDDFRGRTKDLEERAKGKGDGGRKR